MNKKIITELSDEELLNIVKKPSEEIENLFFRNDVPDFLSFYGIKTGRFKVPQKLLYKLYKKWSQIPITVQAFTLTLTDLFPKYNTNFLLLNKTSLKLKSTLESYYKVRNKTKQKTYKFHFESFLKRYEIIRGTVFIKNTDLYNLYDKWTYKNNNKHPLGIAQFNNFCKIYFRHKIINREFCFAVNESIYKHLTQEMAMKIKEKNVEQKEKQKIKREISRFRENFKPKDKN